MARTQAGMAIFVALAVVVNLVCFGPVVNLLNLVFGSGQLTEETMAEAEAACLDIAEEGVVLLENQNNVLPLNSGANLNVFGWASTNPCYGGTGAGHADLPTDMSAESKRRPPICWTLQKQICWRPAITPSSINSNFHNIIDS